MFSKTRGELIRFALIGLLFLAQVAVLRANPQIKGEIQLQVNDPRGLPLQASGHLYGPGVDRTFQTDPHGASSLDALMFGRYRLEISSSGFAPTTLTIEVTSTTPVSQHVTLLIQGASSITVHSPAPIGAADLSLDEIPVPVQGLTAKQLEDSNALDLADLMNRRMTSVYINENAGNPYQPDLNYRGYTASPLLGTPEGLSVYPDGVRQSQPFGDIVAWDLIPKWLFGTWRSSRFRSDLWPEHVGGAIAVQTKDGLTAQGGSLQITGGTFGMRAGEGEAGGLLPKGFNYYVAGNLYREDGWRQIFSIGG